MLQFIKYQLRQDFHKAANHLVLNCQIDIKYHRLSKQYEHKQIISNSQYKQNQH